MRSWGKGFGLFDSCLTGRCHHAATPFFIGRLTGVLLFCDQKRSRKVPLLPGRGARPRGCSPLGTPKLWSRSKKAKKRRSAAFFFTLFHSSPIDPPGLDSLWFYRGCRGAQCAPAAVCLILRLRANNVRPYTLARPHPFAEESAAGSRQTNLC